MHLPLGDHVGFDWRCSLTVNCVGHPPSEGTSHRLFLPVMLETKTMLLPSGDQAVPPIWRVMYSRSSERPSSPCSTLASGFAVICLGSVIACGGVIVCETASVLINTTITNRRMGFMMAV